MLALKLSNNSKIQGSTDSDTHTQESTYLYVKGLKIAFIRECGVLNDGNITKFGFVP